jgi:hypothetical protein
MQRPKGYKYPDPNFQNGELWGKMENMLKDYEKISALKAGASHTQLKRSAPTSTQNAIPPKRAVPVHHVQQEEVKEAEQAPDNCISNIPWAAHVAAAYDCSPEVQETLFHLQDTGTCPGPKKETPSIGGKEKNCSFCLEKDKSHHSWDCPLPIDQKQALVVPNNICRKCLQIGHKFNACPKQMRPCLRCGGESHHKVLCVARVNPSSLKSGDKKIKFSSQRGQASKFGGQSTRFVKPNRPKSEAAPVFQTQVSEIESSEDEEDPDRLPESTDEFMAK